MRERQQLVRVAQAYVRRVGARVALDRHMGNFP